ncbi:MAG: fused MFS/spermidine synthase [Solirubrobacteraceae bacterium]
MATQRPRLLLAMAFCGGMASLGGEIAAARLLAPYFGASTIIWANTIGVVLVALSVGYWYGGRLADRRPDIESLARVVLAAAALLALVPFVADPFLDAVISAFDAIDAGAFVGSLLAVLLLLSIPMLLLGTVTPWALRLAIDDVSRAGQIAGRLYAVSTLGSLAGVFLSALVLIPLIGTQRTFIAFGAVLAIAAAAGLRSPRAALVPVLLLAALALPVGLTKGDANDGERVIAEQETTYQYLRVIEEDGRRRLELNEGQATHSVYEPDTVLTGGVWDGYLVLPQTVLDDSPASVAMLGNAAGTVSRAYGRHHPESRIDGVELDGDVTTVGRELFELDSNPRLTTYEEDARPFLRRTDERYDAIFVDAYRQPYIPFYLATTEFFELVRDRLEPGGAVVLNVGHPPGQDALERTLTQTIETAFPYVRRWAIEDENTLLVASETEPTAERLEAADIGVEGELDELQGRAVVELGAPLSGGSVYTDDRAPVEWLIDASILRFATGEDVD